MAQVQSGDTVKIHYKGTLDDGTVFDSSEGRDPLQFEVGSGQIIPGLDEAIPGMGVGESKTVTIEPEQAYGEPNPNAIQSVPRNTVPEELNISVGMPLQVQTEDGRQVNVTVKEITDDTVVLDANHPLAGKTLTFEIELVSIGA